VDYSLDAGGESLGVLEAWCGESLGVLEAWFGGLAKKPSG
jgi:hypothetical protein